MSTIFTPGLLAENGLDTVFYPEGWEAQRSLPLSAEEDFNLNGLSDEDYLAGHGMTKAEVLAEHDYSDCYSTFDADNFEHYYMQSSYN